MNVKALTRSASVTIALIAIATIASELSAPFKGLLSSIGGHHWIGKSILSIVFFCLLHLIFSKVMDDELRMKDTWVLISSVVLSGLAIFAFYVTHY